MKIIVDIPEEIQDMYVEDEFSSLLKKIKGFIANNDMNDEISDEEFGSFLYLCDAITGSREHTCNCMKSKKVEDSAPDNVVTIVTSLDIVVDIINGKPYYMLTYVKYGESLCCVGYASYNINEVVKHMSQFKVVDGPDDDLDLSNVTTAYIIAEMYGNTPYYSIKYRKEGESEHHIGYSSYYLDIVIQYMKDYFPDFV